MVVGNTVNYIEFNKANIATDPQGYLLNMADWSPELAEVIAVGDQIELTQAHWEVVNFVRNFYLEYNTSPAANEMPFIS